MPVQRYVFSCVKNQAKDLGKRKRRPKVYLDDTTAVDDEVGHVGADAVYADVERVAPTLPADLTDLEQEIIMRLYLDATARGSATGPSATRRAPVARSSNGQRRRTSRRAAEFARRARNGPTLPNGSFARNGHVG
jgi:hypothetical protein